MKKTRWVLVAVCLLSRLAHAGTATYSGKEMKQVAPLPCPEWYRDTEFNVGLWGTYVFTGNEWANDRYLQADHAWGGGGDFKYFFHRYFGVGVEGWAVSARRAFGTFEVEDGIIRDVVGHENRVVGAVLGTLTLRYPIPCTRWAPYAFAGGGGIFGGGEDTDTFVLVSDDEVIRRVETSGSETRAIGQFGGGVEFRITPLIGWTSDFTWNVIDGPHNNFGMVRSGLNFAF
jgi:hypothetical protein